MDKEENKKKGSDYKGRNQREWYEMMGTPEGGKIIYRTAEARRKDRQDIGEVGVIKDENGNIFTEKEEVKRRWKEYFSQLLNIENECEELENVPPVDEPIANIRQSEVENAIKKGKGTKKSSLLVSETNRTTREVGKVSEDERARTSVQTKYGETEAFIVEVGLHQGSALSPFLFLVVTDTLASELRNNKELWELMFADDLVIIADREELQERFLTWKGALEKKGLKVKIGKTELIISGKEGHKEVNIQVEDGTMLK
ncbi:uncharacterized protein [Macrobrachium rosenbergii]|uniref:uncharacterized protein n=1 Tax=Macrobrachium rosenbergii TaxID=79674 RepID=UPI0034D3A17A